MRRLTIEGKTTIFKTLAISKISYTFQQESYSMNQTKYKKNIWSAWNFNIKHNTLCKNYGNRGLKTGYVLSKITIL